MVLACDDLRKKVYTFYQSRIHNYMETEWVKWYTAPESLVSKLVH